MEFGVLFTSHPNHATEPYPHRAVHARVTAELQAADRLGYDTAWVAEHHFSNQYGIMPDVFTYMGYLAAQTSRIRLGTAVVVLAALISASRIVGRDLRQQAIGQIGLGAAGHTASPFPGAVQDHVTQSVAVAPAAAGWPRLTLTLPVINAARVGEQVGLT